MAKIHVTVKYIVVLFIVTLTPCNNIDNINGLSTATTYNI